MKLIFILLICLAVVFFVLLVFSLAAVSGRCSREEEKPEWPRIPR